MAYSFCCNLSIHSEYDGTDEVVIGDSSGLHVSHVGSLVLKSPTRTFHLNDTLCVPNILKNLISVHHFTSQNNVFVEFHPLFFLVKDKITGAVLLKSACENGIYTLPDLLVQASPKMGMAKMRLPHTKIPIKAIIAHLEAQIIPRNPMGSANTLQSAKSVMNWATSQNIVHVCALLSPLPIILPLHLQQTQNGLFILL